MILFHIHPRTVPLETLRFTLTFGLGGMATTLILLLSEMEPYDEDASYLGSAADGMTHHSRARYNYALALLKLKRWQEGAEAL